MSLYDFGVYSFSELKKGSPGEYVVVSWIASGKRVSIKLAFRYLGRGKPTFMKIGKGEIPIQDKQRVLETVRQIKRDHNKRQLSL